MIKFASENMINELKSLWVECFEGDGAYCDFFFENYFSCENCVVSVNDNDEVEAAAYIFRGEVRVEGKVHSVVFLYAGATFKKYRKSGKCSAICSFAADYCRNSGIDIIALSTSASSLSLCEKGGMVPAVYMRAAHINSDKSVRTYPCVKCGYEEFADMRKDFLSNDFDIYWTGETLKYMYAEMQTSGDIVKTVIGGSTYYAAFTVFDDELLIRETNCPRENIAEMANSVCGYAHYSGKITVYTKSGAPLDIAGGTADECFCYAHMQFINAQLNIPDAQWYINLTAE